MNMENGELFSDYDNENRRPKPSYFGALVRFHVRLYNLI
jgi:hypothetical protein